MVKFNTLQAIALAGVLALAPGLSSCTSEPPRKSYSAVCSAELMDLGISGSECSVIKGFYDSIDTNRLSREERKWADGMNPEKIRKVIDTTGNERDKKVIRAVCNIQNPSARDYVFTYHYLFGKYLEK